MPISLREVLAHPSVAPASPELLTGDGATQVRWVHSSEVLELAHLLRGGELVLTAGLVLVNAPAAHQRRYVRDLVTRGVAAVAIETTAPVPAPVLDEAGQLGFAVVRLARTVPFVGVAESINGLLVNESVHRLRLADTVSEELSEQLISGGDVHDLVDALASRLDAVVSVRAPSGDVLADSGAEPGPPHRGTWRAPVVVRHVVMASLEVRPSERTDRDLLEAALDRAPQSFALALMRAQPSEVDSGAAGAFFHALQRVDPPSTPMEALVAATPLAGARAFVAVLASGAHLGAIDQAARRHGRRVLSHVASEDLVSVVGLPPDSGEPARRDLIEDVRHTAGEHVARVVVGPLTSAVGDLPRAVAEARRCLDFPVPDLVVDASRWSVERLITRLDDREAWQDFVHEHLGPVLALDAETRERLVTTLVAYVECTANKVATARRLHVQRQTLYQRLQRLGGILQQDLTTPSADLCVAVRVLRALKATHHGDDGGG